MMYNRRGHCIEAFTPSMKASWETHATGNGAVHSKPPQNPTGNGKLRGWGPEAPQSAGFVTAYTSPAKGAFGNAQGAPSKTKEKQSRVYKCRHHVPMAPEGISRVLSGADDGGLQCSRCLMRRQAFGSALEGSRFLERSRVDAESGRRNATAINRARPRRRLCGSRHRLPANRRRICGTAGGYAAAAVSYVPSTCRIAPGLLCKVQFRGPYSDVQELGNPATTYYIHRKIGSDICRVKPLALAIAAAAGGVVGGAVTTKQGTEKLPMWMHVGDEVVSALEADESSWESEWIRALSRAPTSSSSACGGG